jgi:hypothetical protein
MNIHHSGINDLEIPNERFILNTKGCINMNNNCFLNCLILAMFGYTKSPFYKLKKFKNEDSKLVFNCFLKIIGHVKKNQYPDISIMRNILPMEMRYGQQDSSETFDQFMKILNFEPMKVWTVRESKNKKTKDENFKGNLSVRNVSYITLDNDGSENYKPIKFLFYPEKWEDLGSSPNNWVQDDNDNPKYRYTRQKIKEITGNCLIFNVNRGMDVYNRHKNRIVTPITIENGNKKFFRFAIILHLSSGINYGHYVLVLFDGNKHYLYDDMNNKKIINCPINFENDDNIEYIERNSVMYFYYLI